MKVFSFDWETEAVRPGKKIGEAVCLTFQRDRDPEPSIVRWCDARAPFEMALHDPRTLMVGHFVAYDMLVAMHAWPDLIPAIVKAYDENRVTCTMLREKLWDIALGIFRGFADERGVWRKHNYDLDAVARRRAGIALKKDGWRKRYGEFRDIPITLWPQLAAQKAEEARAAVAAGVKDKDLLAIAMGEPEEVVRYPLHDARATLAVYLKQEAVRPRNGADDPFVDEFNQSRASCWLTGMASWGLRTHGPGVDWLEASTHAAVEDLTKGLIQAGLVRADGSRDTKAAVQRMLDVMGWRMTVNDDKSVKYEKARHDARPLRKTKGNGVSLDRDACKASDDPVLIDYGNRAQLSAVLAKDVPMLRLGEFMPVHSRFDIVASGRTSSSAPNIQNLRRIAGIREAFIPRQGMVFAQADYPGLELRTLAQCLLWLFGKSRLADMLNRGEDPHLAFAAELLGLTYEETKRIHDDKSHARWQEVDDARQIGKVFNFGSPGGLGAEKLCLFARKTYNVQIEVAQAKEWKQAWLRALPEMRDYFAHVSRLTENGDATIKQLRSNRLRGKTPYTAACNTYFQGLGADATKAAGWEIFKACYVDRNSPLFGSRTVAYIHDEFIVETPDTDRAHDVAIELGRVMLEAANKWVPDVPFKKIEPQLMRVWSKDAKPLHHWETGRLLPWEPALGGLMGMGKAIAAKHKVAA